MKLVIFALWATVLLGVPDLSHADEGKKVFCYYSSFAQNRQGIGKFLPEDIHPFLCTHLIFAFVDISPDGSDLVPFNRNDAGPHGLYRRTIALKDKNPALKVLLAVGGWQIGSKPFIPMISDPDTMRRWIKNVIVYLRRFDFDGFDVDWEFPATRGSPPEDRYRYTLLMKGLYEAFAEESRETGREKLLLTMATASGTFFISTSYEPRKIIPYMDYMLLMTYNYHGQWEKRTGHHSPLLKHSNDPPGEQSELYQNWSIDYWLEQGMPKDKLVVGMATYGMSFTLQDPRQHGVHSPAKGGGRMGRYTKETGILAYYEICQNLQEKGWRTGWIEEQHVPYAYGGDQWVGYDTVDSIKIKADNVMKRGLAGAFVWSVEMDDFGGVCGDGRYPIMSSIAKVLQPYKKGSSIAAPAVKDLKLLQEGSNPQVASETSDDVNSVSAPAESKHRPRARDEVSAAAKRRQSRRKMSSSSASATDNSPVVAVTPAAAAAAAAAASEERTRPTKKKQSKWWGEKVWRPKSTGSTGRRTQNPWWKRTTQSLRHSANHNARTTQRTWHATNWNARPTGRPHSRRSHSSSSTESRSQGEENSVEQSKHQEVEANEHSSGKSSPSRSEERSEQKSSAGAMSGGAVTCHGLGSGLHLHPDDCEKFIMCMPGSWLDLPPHVMFCPTGTRFDERIKVCNHAGNVPCYN